VVSLSQQQHDDIFNALIIGMTPEDAYIFAKLSAEEIVWCSEDEDTQNWIRQTQKQLEYNLLNQMKDGAQKQISVGKTDATQWLLEHLYPRYSAKASPDVGTINFVMSRERTEDIESVVGDVLDDVNRTLSPGNTM